MSRAEILDRIQTIIRGIFDDDTLEITESTVAADVEEWDSLEQINILVAAERDFDVKFSVGDVEGLRNVGELVDLVASKLA
jgi:acyl carrier protein